MSEQTTSVLNRRTQDAIVNAMTVDVEDYFQVSAFDHVISRAAWDSFESRVVANTERLLELFDRSGIRATFFVLGWVASRFPSLVKRIAEGGHEVASHGYHHRLLYTLTPDEFREDIRAAKAAIESAAGVQVIGFRAPSFSLVASTEWALDILIEEGYRYDTSIFPIRHDRYGMPGAPRHIHVLKRAAGELVEMPPSTVRIGGINFPVAGGGYFRLFPYAWTRWGIRRINTVDRRPAIFYVHPWEVDPRQPRIAVGPVTRMRHYTGLNETLERLTRLLGEFRFGPAADVLRIDAHVEPPMPHARATPAMAHHQ